MLDHGKSAPRQRPLEAGRAVLRQRLIARALAMAVLLSAVVLLWVIHDPGIRQLPYARRQALFDRTWSTLQEFCLGQPQPPPLHEYCRQQANFVLSFDECDAACRARFESQPVR
jgi:hypothetical protein